MSTFLIFGGIWFWILTVIAAIIVTACIEIENNSGLGANFCILIFGLLLYYFGNGDSFRDFGNYIATHPGMAILIFFGYMLLGGIWSLCKWALFLIDARKNIEEGSTFRKSDWVASQHKSRITHWIIYWPLSGLWTIVNNPVKKFATYIFDTFSGTYQSISDRIMKEHIKG